jgi:hypothetical protein
MGESRPRIGGCGSIEWSLVARGSQQHFRRYRRTFFRSVRMRQIRDTSGLLINCIYRPHNRRTRRIDALYIRDIKYVYYKRVWLTARHVVRMQRKEPSLLKRLLTHVRLGELDAIGSILGIDLCCYDCAWLSLTALSTVTCNLWL